MTRKLSLPAALVLAIAAIGAGASPANAAEFEFEAKSYPAVVIGTEVTPHELGVDAGSLECKTASFLTSLAGPSGTLAITPSFDKCTLAGLPTTFEGNGCLIYFVEDTYTQKTVQFDVITKIGCPAGKEMTFVSKVATTAKCTIHIPEQELGTGTTMVEKVTGGVKDLTAQVLLGGLKYAQTAGTGLAKCLTADNTKDGVYTGESTLIAYDQTGVAIDLWAPLLP